MYIPFIATILVACCRKAQFFCAITCCAVKTWLLREPMRVVKIAHSGSAAMMHLKLRGWNPKSARLDVAFIKWNMLNIPRAMPPEHGRS